MSETNVMHGALVKIRREGRTVALARSFQKREMAPLVSVDPLGQPHHEEHIRVSYEVEVSFEVYRVFGKGMVAMGIFPSKKNMTAFINHPEQLLEVYDNATGDVLERLTGFKAEESDVSYQKGDLSVYNVRGKALIATDEADN